MKELTILLGNHRGFAGLSRGRLEYDKVARRAGVRPLPYRYVPAEHKIRVTDAQAEGLIQESKEWQEANRQHRQGGGQPHRFEVKEVKDLGPDPVPETAITAAQLQAANIAALKDVTDVLKLLVTEVKSIKKASG